MDEIEWLTGVDSERMLVFIAENASARKLFPPLATRHIGIANERSRWQNDLQRALAPLGTLPRPKLSLCERPVRMGVMKWVGSAQRSLWRQQVLRFWKRRRSLLSLHVRSCGLMTERTWKMRVAANANSLRSTLQTSAVSSVIPFAPPMLPPSSGLPRSHPWLKPLTLNVFFREESWTRSGWQSSLMPWKNPAWLATWWTTCATPSSTLR